MARRLDNGFVFYKVTRTMEEEGKSGTPRLLICREDLRAVKIIERYKPMDNRIFAVVNSQGKYRGRLTERELLNGIYYCGIYADFKTLLEFKRTGTETETYA